MPANLQHFRTKFSFLNLQTAIVTSLTTVVLDGLCRTLPFLFQFFGVIVAWLYITRVEDAIEEYGNYQDSLINTEAKNQGKLVKCCKCMPLFD